jgi:hypothetical protein
LALLVLALLVLALLATASRVRLASTRAAGPVAALRAHLVLLAVYILAKILPLILASPSDGRWLLRAALRASQGVL